MTYFSNAEWNVQKHLNMLLTEGATLQCDDGNVKDLKLKLPEWYDPKLFKRGQKFYQENIFAMHTATMCGLIGVLAVPSILDVLRFTEKSSTPMTAYRRYSATTMHVCVWYDVELNEDGTGLMESLLKVRKLHLMADQSACKHSVGRVTQKDLVLTQFAFVGYVLLQAKMLGIVQNDRRNQEAFVHMWRVIGNLLGIEDRFNVCRESHTETLEYCDAIMQQVYKPLLTNTDEHFEHMCRAMLDGMWVVSPMLDYDAVMFYAKRIAGVENYEYYDSEYAQNKGTVATREPSEQYKSMSNYSKFILYLVVNIHSKLLKWRLLRMYYNAEKRFYLFAAKRFPLLAAYWYGNKNAWVDIHVGN